MDDPGIYEEIVRLRAAGRRAALATIVQTKGSTPRHEKAKLLLREDGTTLGTIGGGSLENEVLRRAEECLKTGRHELVKLDLGGKDKDRLGMLCGGKVEVFIEIIGAPPRFLIFGAGHVSKALVPMLKLMGLQVTVVDERPDMLNLERFPDADGMAVKKNQDAFKELDPDPMTGLAILTNSHEQDLEVLRWAVMTEAGYVGMIGSRTKVKTLYEKLEKEGIPQERLSRVHAPIGLDIGAETPAEIAVAIAAEIVKYYRKPPRR
ncbi:XdhC family protein [Acidobacteriota bacterium]